MLEIFTRDVVAGKERARVAGIGSVVTKAEHRKQGIATAMLERAASVMRDQLDVEFGMLICRGEVAPVYVKSGWVRVEGSTRFWQPSGMVIYPYETMVLKLGEREWPAGAIDLNGLPW